MKKPLMFFVICSVLLFILYFFFNMVFLLEEINEISKKESEIQRRRTRLTELYGEDVKKMVQNFEAQWFSDKAANDYEFQRSLVTLDFLKLHPGSSDDHELFTFGIVSDVIGSSDALVKASSVTVITVTVLEYSPQKISAFAALKYTSDKFSAEDYGRINSLGYPIGRRCTLYIFTQENERWKLDYWIDYNRDKDTSEACFEMLPQETRDLIEEPPGLDPCRWRSLRD